ncbi:MAG: lipid-A-disaccharide synthase [Candidatus Marinimicrobia bacterium]|nr:lipid-A-disaccharide synthase [Candidatus Neomarinimicrobiota bacterium]MBL7067083.1 lipid-A-disaccharide synthase [Candidatus Neomarinimicrobiota bacterium]
MSSKKIFISAGELSGDIHGGNLVSAIRQINPGIKITAIGGDNMAGAGAELLYHIRETSIMGFAEIVKHLPFIRKLWKNTLRHIDKIKPDLVVVIDYPGFNLRLAKAVSKRNIPVIYYISPQVWAWHQSRIKKIKRYTKEVLCILPFEEEWFRKRGVNARFVGHPLLDQIAKEKNSMLQSTSIRPTSTSLVIGLFPGSRLQEVQRHLPVMIESVRKLRDKFPEIVAAVSIAPKIDMSAYRKVYDFEWLYWIGNRNPQLINESDLLIMSSGTATLEATIFHTPMIVIYRLNSLSYRLGKLLIKVPYITIANLITNKRGITELIQHDANADTIASEAETILTNPQRRDATIQFLKNVSQRLGKPGASERVARIILEYI